MAGKKKSKQKVMSGSSSSSASLLLAGPSYSMANTSFAATATTTVNKTPVLTTMSGGSYSCKSNNTNSDNDNNYNSISFFDSISSIDKRIGESGGDSSAFDFEELSAVLNGQSTDINSCFGNSSSAGREKKPGLRNNSSTTNNNNYYYNSLDPVDKSSSIYSTSINDLKTPVADQKDKRTNNNKDKTSSDSKKVDSEVEDKDNDDDKLFPKIVKVCSLAANATNAAANHIANSNKNKSSTTNKEDEINSKFMRRMQYSLLGDGPNYGGMYTRENGSTNASSIEGGVDEDDDEGDGDDTLVGSDFQDDQYYNLVQNAGHYLSGGAGLDSLSYSSGSSSFDGGISQIPSLTSCSTIWDGIINICEISTCSKSANKKCGLCKSAFYCNEEHQKLDWKKHKNECIPYKLDCIANDGPDGPVSAMVASRNIPEGKIVFSEKPLLVLPIAQVDSNFTHIMENRCVRNGGVVDSKSCGAIKSACLGCLKIIDCNKDVKYSCSKCSLPLCSARCEYAMEHQNLECSAITSNNYNALLPKSEASTKNCLHSQYMDVEILRALQLGCYGNPNGEWETFLGLKNNVRVEAYRHTELYYTFTKHIKSLVPFSVKVSGYNYDLISDVHSIITALSYKPSLNSPFKLIFGTQLLFLHDCIPNTFHFIENEKTGCQHKMKLVTKTAIPICKGEIISIDFVPTPYLPYTMRKKYLQNLSIESCRCGRCLQPSRNGDHSGDIRCPNCRDGIIRAEFAQNWEESVWSCNRCQEECPYNNVRKLEFESNALLAEIPKSRGSLWRLVDFIDNNNKHACLHPSHSIIISAWCYIEAIIRQNLENVREPTYFKKYNDDTLKEFQLLARYCDVLGPHLDLVRHGLWIDKGIILFHKFYAHFALASNDFQSKTIIRKEYIQRVLRAMKALQEGLKHLITFYEGYDTPKYVARLTQEGTHALSSLKEFIGHLMIKDAAESTTTTRLTPSTNL